MPALVKTTDLLDEIQVALDTEGCDERVGQYANTLLFWVLIHLKDRYMVLSDVQVRMRQTMTGEIAE